MKVNREKLKKIIVESIKENLEFDERYSLAAHLHDHIVDWLHENGLVLDGHQMKEIQLYAGKIVAAAEKGIVEATDPMAYKLATTWEDGWQAAKDGMTLDDNPWEDMLDEGKK